MNEIREINGTRYGRDAFGWIWIEITEAADGEPHWIKTPYDSFEEIS